MKNLIDVGEHGNFLTDISRSFLAQMTSLTSSDSLELLEDSSRQQFPPASSHRAKLG